jgi:hypothetical protein
MPFTEVTVAEPVVKSPGPAVLKVTLAPSTELPNASVTLTVILGNVWPATMFTGLVVKLTESAAAGFTVNELDGTEVSPAALALSV